MEEVKQTNTGIYQHKNVTIHIKREYSHNKRLSDILNSLIVTLHSLTEKHKAIAKSYLDGNTGCPKFSRRQPKKRASVGTLSNWHKTTYGLARDINTPVYLFIKYRGNTGI
jgi:hypothetical protein